MTTTRETLIAARALVAKGWCQGEYARNQSGEKVHLNDSSASCFCTAGAISKAADYLDSFRSYMAATKVFCEFLDTGDLVSWNDHPDRTQAEVLAAFDRAIEGCS